MPGWLNCSCVSELKPTEGIMVAVGVVVASSWFLPPGVASFFILLLLLSIFLTALCSDCNRRTFELHDPEVDKNPSALIRVVKLEDTMVARENPMSNEIQNDEKETNHSEEDPVHFTAWRSHLEAPQNHQEPSSEEENPAQFPPWRSHLGAPQDQGGSSSTPSGNAALDSNSVYAQVSRKEKHTSPVNAPEQVQVQEEEEPSPPLPARRTEVVG